MNWEQFLKEFVFRVMTNNIHDFSPEDAARLARKAWDAIQSLELPESEKAKQSVIVANSPNLKPSNSTELKAMARTALDLFSDNADWIAIDENGRVWAYDLKPTVNELWRNWSNSVDGGSLWEIGTVAPPEDFTKELYEISKLLESA